MRTRSIVISALLLAGAPGAVAAQDLGAFLAAAPRSAEVREADAAVRQREAERTQSLGALLPALTARAAYTRNEVEVSVTIPSTTGNSTEAVITPTDQLDATISLDVPVLDLGAWARLGAAREGIEAARARAVLVHDDARRAVARQWFTWVGAHALRAAAARNIEAAERLVTRARRHVEAGTGTELDVQRAEAEAARAAQDGVDAELAAAAAARALQSLTGVAAVAPPALAPDDLRDEGPLARWELDAAGAPAVRAARADVRAADATARAAWLRFAPTVNATATQRWTNAAGFGPEAVWAAGVSVTWRLDVATFGAAQAGRAIDEAAVARAERTLRDARDAVFNAWSQVRAGVARARAARSREVAAEAAARSARERQESGVGTQLDVLLAERDVASARVARVQADADLGYARALLRIAASRPL